MSTCMLTHNIPDGSNVQSMLKSKVLGLLAIYLYIYMYIYIYIHIIYIRTVRDFNPHSNIDVGMYSFCGPILEDVFNIILANIDIYIYWLYISISGWFSDVKPLLTNHFWLLLKSWKLHTPYLYAQIRLLCWYVESSSWLVEHLLRPVTSL